MSIPLPPAPPSPPAVHLRVIRGGNRPRRGWRTRRFALGVLVALVIAGGATVSTRLPRAAMAPSPSEDPGALVVDGPSVRITDQAKASELLEWKIAGRAAGGRFPAYERAFREVERVLGPNGPRVVAVAPAAIVTRRSQAYVMVVHGNGRDRLDPVAVTLLGQRDGGVEVAGQLAPGDRYVAGGAAYVFNMLVIRGVL